MFNACQLVQLSLVTQTKHAADLIQHNAMRLGAIREIVLCLSEPLTAVSTNLRHRQTVALTVFVNMWEGEQALANITPVFRKVAPVPVNQTEIAVCLQEGVIFAPVTELIRV